MHKVALHVPRKVKHWLRRALIMTATIIFLADLISSFWPPLWRAWSAVAHGLVAIASFSAFAVEHYIIEDYEAEHRDLHPRDDVQ